MDIEFFCEGQSAPTKPGLFPGGAGVYLHGEAEDECRFDIPDSNIDMEDLEDGVFPVTLNENQGYTLFFWRSPNSTRVPRGLVVKDTDTEGVRHARKQYDERPAFI